MSAAPIDRALSGIGPRRFLAAMRDELRGRRWEHIGVVPLGTTIGAEVSGVDLGRLDDAAFAEVERALVDYKVLFFRGQRIGVREQSAFARRFGELEEHPFLPAPEGHGHVIRFEKDADVAGVENVWHSDVSWREVPSLGSVLRCVETPAVGGDTIFADMVAAWEGLPDDVKERVEGLRAVHDFTQSFGRALPPEELAERRRQFPPVEHPVARTHPVSGRRILYVNAIFTSHIVGLEREESDRLLDLLFRQAAVPEYQCRLRWEPDAVAFWDNRAVQHYAASDYWPQRRVMERVTIVGDRPR